MKTLIAAGVATLALAGCADFPVYEQTYYRPSPVYYEPARVVYAPAPIYVERTTVVQAPTRIIREPVIVREPVRVVHGRSEPVRHDFDRGHADDNNRGRDREHDRVSERDHDRR